MTRKTVSDSPTSRALDGFLLLDKPQGLTSQQAVTRVKRGLGARKAGHAGTLDPMATGLLVIGVGKATRLLGHFSDKDKQYEATIRLGWRTTTDDAEGEPIGEAKDATGISTQDILAAMAHYVGEIQQVPSSVSAIKVDGKRAYALVRAGEEVALKPRTVTVTRYDLVSRRDSTVPSPGSVVPSSGSVILSSPSVILPQAGSLSSDPTVLSSDPTVLSSDPTVLSSDSTVPSSGSVVPSPGSVILSSPPVILSSPSVILPKAGSPSPGWVDLDVVVDCSSGTYIRALARDLGEDLGVGGHLVRLRRTKVGKLSVDDAVDVDGVSPDKVMDMGSAAELIAPRVDVPPEWVADIAVGRRIPVQLTDDLVTVFSGDKLLALYRPDPSDSGLARPVAVFIVPEDCETMTNGNKDGI